jgi:hypothetical protein
LGVVVHACNTSNWEGEAGGLSTGHQTVLHSKTLSPKIKKIFFKKPKERKNREKEKKEQKSVSEHH